jgi:hypothetical protein
MNRFSAVVCSILIVLCTWLGACGWGKPPSPIERAWTEDALLEDGTTIPLRRSVKLYITNSWGGDAYNAVEQQAKLSFLGPLKNLPTWSAQYIPAVSGVVGMPLVLYRDQATSEWVIVVTTTSCEVWAAAGKPKPNYWEYRLKEAGWHQVPLSPASIGRATNLFHSYDHELSSSHITVEERRRIENDPLMARKYREIWGDPDIYICGEGNPGKVR